MFTFTTGQNLTAAQLNAATVPLFAYKPGNQGIANSTTFQDDGHLFLPVLANTTYTVEASIGTLANTTADGKLRWTGPTGSLLDWGMHCLYFGATGIIGQGDWEYIRDSGSVSLGRPWGGANIDAWIKVGGLLRVGGTSGTFRLQWAQRVADPGTTWVLQGSWLRLTQVS